MTAPDSEWVWLARLRRPQGRKGEIFAQILTDFPEKFVQRKQLWLLSPQDAKTAPTNSAAPRAVELANHWLHKGGIVLHFAGIDSISQAEELAGLIVAIPRGERATLAEDETYVADLVGCTLIDVAGSAPLSVGIIEDVDRDAGPVPLLIVRGRAGDEILVPFAKSYLRTIDLGARRVEMALPAGLVDLNAPGKASETRPE